MTRAPADRSHLSIGEVLSLLQDEFPDVTISKIRFLESQGLLDPERTPSGYRKFYEGDIDRLRWILRQQKDHYLPLKVIKDRLDDAVPAATEPQAPAREREPAAPEPEPEPAVANGTAVAPAPAARLANGLPVDPERRVVTALALDERLDPVASPPVPGVDAPAVLPTPRPRMVRDPAPPPSPEVEVSRLIEAPPRRSPAPRSVPAPRARAAPRPPAEAAADTASVSLTVEELAQASGLTVRDVRDLESFGMLDGFQVGDATYYDADALVIARTAAGFLEHGIEPRHMRSYKVAIDREAARFEQIVLPLLKQRNPDARRKAARTVTELIRLGDDMRRVLLHRELRNLITPD
ncbi:MAG TPA: MerR family transcriptional regulator [Acidimicrobiales bacterium]|nr:MerR family transcriptional regulator [Acidimicrobiales bacterium]